MSRLFDIDYTSRQFDIHVTCLDYYRHEGRLWDRDEGEEEKEESPVQNPRRYYAGLTFNSTYAHTYTALCIYCECAYECLAAPSRLSPVSRLFHAGCTSS